MKIFIFYTEILTRTVVLWYFFMSEMSEKKSTIKIQLFGAKSQCTNFFKTIFTQHFVTLLADPSKSKINILGRFLLV